jgi:hypothetical protein
MLKNDYIKELEDTLKLVRRDVNEYILNGQLDTAKERINKDLRGLVGLDIGTIDTLPFNSIEELISREDHYNTGKYIALGELLSLEADISDKEANETDKVNYYEKSLASFYKAYDEDNTTEAKYLEGAVRVADELEDYELSIETNIRRLKLYEMNNNFDKAEDVLFYTMELSNSDEYVLSQGLEFYNRLKKKSEQILEDGNLPMEEVEDGILEIEKLING